MSPLSGTSSSRLLHALASAHPHAETLVQAVGVLPHRLETMFVSGDLVSLHECSGVLYRAMDFCGLRGFVHFFLLGQKEKAPKAFSALSAFSSTQEVTKDPRLIQTEPYSRNRPFVKNKILPIFSTRLCAFRIMPQNPHWRVV